MRGHELLGQWTASLVLAGVLVSASRAEAGPITFNTALPVHANELILREQVIWLRATDDPSPMNRNLNVIAVPHDLTATHDVSAADMILQSLDELVFDALGLTPQPQGRER